MNDNLKIIVNILSLIMLAVSITVLVFYVQAVNTNTAAIKEAMQLLDARKAVCSQSE